ncbi:MAG: PLDc N-terminal domain-containing protein, partial [Comamonas sp.]|nr:PLDc N-terminal domain-containing protein [Comamonas sp.]
MTWLFLTLHVLLIVCLGLRILLRNDLQPDVRMGWLTLVVLLPYVSCVLYYLFGEVALRRRGRGHQQQVQDFAVQAHVLQQTSLVGKSRPHPAVAGATERMAAHVAPQWQAAFSYAASVNGFQPQPGHSAELMADGRETLQRMLMDLDAAQHEINLLYYLWRDDQMGTQVAQALVRAAAR